MHLFVVAAAAVVAWVACALWYMVLAGPWVRSAGVQVDNRGRPQNASPRPYLVSGAAMLVISAAMDFIFRLGGIATLMQGLAVGFVIGAFIVSAWQLINNTHVRRPLTLTLIDGGSAVIACSLIGAILGVTAI